MTLRTRGWPAALAALCVAGIVTATSPVAPSALAQARPSAPTPAIPATGYVGKWYFNANDEAPSEVLHVTPQGRFAFSYRPSECSSGAFHIVGAFRSALTTVDGTTGSLVTFTAGGSCYGHQNTFTWKGARGAAVGYTQGAKWPDSRVVFGEMTQVATTASSSGPLEVDWGMSAIPPS